MSSKRFAVIGLLASALTAAACFFGGCEEIIEDPRDGRLVGDWRTIYEDDDGSWIEITSLTNSGYMSDGGFLSVEDFWIEGWENIGTWRTSNDSLYVEVDSQEDYPVAPSRYTILDGNRISINLCENDSCRDVVSEKVDADSIRGRLNTLGNIYGQDQALFTSNAYIDLMWRLEGDSDEIIDFDMIDFYYGERYFGYIEYAEQVWYTVGSRLFLIGMNDNGKVRKTVELEYKIEGAGIDARLYIYPVFDEGGLVQGDVWLPTKYDDSELGFYKSKQGRGRAKRRRGRGALASPWLSKVAAK